MPYSALLALHKGQYYAARQPDRACDTIQQQHALMAINSVINMVVGPTIVVSKLN